MTEPLLTLTYTLTTADALAYEALPRELIGWRKWLLLVWLAVAGGLVAFLPVEWIGPEWGWRFWLAALVLVGLAYGVATLVMTLATHRRARRRVPAPMVVTLQQWGDHLAVTTAERQLFVAYETIADVAIGKAHVFITAPPEALIVPLSAFADRDEMVAFGDHVDRLSREAVP
ncbi:hypothetical protein [Devosia sp.]|uniref:hypothetical protein n=1 Tax=Devosia sp. TaxID=1871048 RepID=UPI003F71E85B